VPLLPREGELRAALNVMLPSRGGSSASWCSIRVEPLLRLDDWRAPLPARWRLTLKSGAMTLTSRWSRGVLEDKTLVIKRSTVTFRLHGVQMTGMRRERVQGFHWRFRPVATSSEGGIDVRDPVRGASA